MLIGTWELVSLSAQLPNGQTIEPWGHAPPGPIIYDANGYMMALIVGVPRDEGGPDQEASRSDDRFTSYFGTYEIDRTTGEIVHHVTATLSRMQASGELRRRFALHDDQLVLSFTWMFNGMPVENRLVWRRLNSRDQE